MRVMRDVRVRCALLVALRAASRRRRGSHLDVAPLFRVEVVVGGGLVEVVVVDVPGAGDAGGGDEGEWEAAVRCGQRLWRAAAAAGGGVGGCERQCGLR